MAIIRFQFESHLFDGFQAEIDISTAESLDEIIASAISVLYGTLKLHNFRSLIDHLDPLVFEITGVTIDQIKKNLDRVVIISEIDEDTSSDTDADTGPTGAD